jgi:predicted transcriptional regulator
VGSYATSDTDPNAILPPMGVERGIQGELQEQIMTALWRVGPATVEQVRTALPARYRGAYNTVQTVLNRLTDRGLLTRRRQGLAFVYTPKLSEAEYLSRTIETTLRGTSSEVRQAVLAQLVGALDSEQLKDLRKLAGRTKGSPAGRRK